MRIRKPDYYDRFHCIAGACKDSCCIGWEIDVDEEKREAYRKVTGALGERLRTCVDWEEGHFVLQGKEERCPFLNQENLCELIMELGEESLCDICREHPRFYEWYENLTEVGLGLCCEEAARLLFEEERPIQFVTEEDICSEKEEGMAVDWNHEEGYMQEEKEIELTLFRARDKAYSILQNREIPIWRRLSQYLQYVKDLQNALDSEDVELLQETVKNRCYDSCYPEQTEHREECLLDAYHLLLRVCEKLDKMDETWLRTLTKRFSSLEGRLDFGKNGNTMMRSADLRSYEYEHIAVYLTYRYFMKCRDDGDLYSRGMLMIFFVILILLMDSECYADSGRLSKEDRAQHAKQCSKEIEYCEENLDALADMFWDDPEIEDAIQYILYANDRRH